MRKGEIACYKQFLLFSQCFPQLYIFHASELLPCVVMGYSFLSKCFQFGKKSRVLLLGQELKNLNLSQTTLCFYMSAAQVFRKQCEKRRNVHNEQFLLFPSVSYHFGKLSMVLIKLKTVLCKHFEFGTVHHLLFGKGKWSRVFCCPRENGL